MEKKNCMFQYATRHRVLVDSNLMSLEDANALFDKNIDDYKERLLNGEEPEMCIWINCKNNSDYHETSKHWHSDDIKVIDGEIYQRV